MEQPPTSDQIGQLYDHLGAYYATLWEGDIHVGVWLAGDDPASMTEAQDRLTRMFIERTPVAPGYRVLDVGCGTGKPAVELVRTTGCRAVGITVSRWQVDEARRYVAERGFADRVEIELADAMELPYEDASFDAVWALESMVHMPDRLRALREMARVARPGAPVVISDIVNEKPLTDEERDLFYPALGVASLVSLAEYPDWIARAGLETVEVLDLGQRVERTVGEMMRLIQERRDRLEEAYPPEFLAQLTDAWSTISRIHAEKMGYGLFLARRPE